MAVFHINMSSGTIFTSTSCFCKGPIFTQPVRTTCFRLQHHNKRMYMLIYTVHSNDTILTTATYNVTECRNFCISFKVFYHIFNGDWITE